MTMTVIRHIGRGGELDRVELNYEDATVERIAQATINMIAASMAMSEGDTITVTVED